jgi:hypothetical protein
LSASATKVLRRSQPIADGLTAVQAHILVGEILERIAVPKPSERAPSVAESDPVAQEAAADSPSAVALAARRFRPWLLRQSPHPSPAAQ